MRLGNCVEESSPMEDVMRRLFTVFVRELTGLAYECVKCTFVGTVFLLGMGFQTDGLPRLAAAINGQSPVRVAHPSTSQLEALNHMTSPPGDSHGQN